MTCFSSKIKTPQRYEGKYPSRMSLGFLNKNKKSSKSLLVHIRGEGDEFFYTKDRDDIMDLLKRLYAYLMKQNLPVFAPAKSKLIYYCTTQEEGERGLTRMPDKQYALPDEKILEGDTEQEPDSPSIPETDFDEIPSRQPSRHDPGYAKYYNNEDFLKKQQDELKDGKVKRIMKARLVKNSYTEDDTREYKYNTHAIKAPHVTKFKKWSSEDAPHSFESEKLHDDVRAFEGRKRRLHVAEDTHKRSPYKENLVEYEEEKVEVIYEEIEDSDETPKCRTDVSLDDFRVKRVIDKGSFGEVFLTEYLPDGKKYAMKRIKKSILTDKSLKESTENEKEILMNLTHPFLLTMSYLIENEKRYYFFLEYISGGNMYKNMFKVKRFEEEAVKFYVAQLALGLAYLHENNLVHRDLKLENILVGKDGYIKL
mmetsp:Transcript_7127/g.6663  ORF Transcript_7127/g.6663 Transcript_7127/m.6663 type:complete len:424 (+) Transcript_7127:104-1375(+)|eukprot:CAMPEP_0197004278 /NCGR_PEP_ID=MMETSP1380-20130617/21192_1 /TAXON_ID=5936 /ORGANISM="Euplotes crassus, Strain CT5" /LENGTH=423 /DNA_ID=CAMNT_0042423017 /DNA_START=97 /DNA_END=1368 /DNA_ORIENTATION=-